MHVPPEIAALRSDRAPQREAQTAMKRALELWLAESAVAQVRRDLVAYGAGESLAECAGLQSVFATSGRAEAILASLTAHFCAELRDNPMGHPPFRAGFDGVVGSIQLVRSGTAHLSLHAREPGKFAATAHRFSDCQRHEAVVGGSARARIVRRLEAGGGTRFAVQRLALRQGSRLSLDLAREALQFSSVSTRLVVLRLSRQRSDPRPSREYDAATGKLLHQSAGDLATSRLEASIALLGRMGRKDAARPIAHIARGHGDTSLRWQALRECLALDTAEGFAALRTLASDAADPLAAPAGALRAQLLEMHPELAQLEAMRCRA